MEALGLTLEMVVVLGVLGLTVFLFVSEIVRVDVAAIIIMVLLGCLRHAFPAAYCERVAALPVIEDPDAARRERNWRTVERLRTR